MPLASTGRKFGDLVYSTCIFCHASLGTNEVIERFPIGRRLAFDADKGRLWAVCRRCQRWNLTPIEERWEAIEECERRFRATTTRVTTGEIGLCQVREGLSLVRIGRPLLPEMAAWRYGGQLTRRWRQRIAMGVAGIPLSFAGVAVAHVLLPGHDIFATALSQIPTTQLMRFAFAEDPLRPWRLLFPFRLRLDRFGLPGIHRVWWSETELVRGASPSDPWRLRIRYRVPRQNRPGKLEVTGPDAITLAAQVLAQINAAGGRRAVVTSAVERLEAARAPAELYRSITTVSCLPSRGISLVHLERDRRLALEMAANEDSERRAMEGELRELEDQWRAAEEIANIADNLLLPASVEAFLRKHRFESR